MLVLSTDRVLKETNKMVAGHQRNLLGNLL